MGFIIQVVFCSTELFASESPKHYQGTFIHAAIETLNSITKVQIGGYVVTLTAGSMLSNTVWYENGYQEEEV